MNVLSVAVDLLARLVKAHPEIELWNVAEVRNWGVPHGGERVLVAWDYAASADYMVVA